MLTCSEVNEALAKRRGESRPGIMLVEILDLQQPVADYVNTVPPDYCHDEKWGAILLAELVMRKPPPYSINIVRCATVDGWELWEHNGEHVTRQLGAGDGLSEASARARLLVYEEERDA